MNILPARGFEQISPSTLQHQTKLDKKVYLTCWSPEHMSPSTPQHQTKMVKHVYVTCWSSEQLSPSTLQHQTILGKNVGFTCCDYFPATERSSSQHTWRTQSMSIMPKHCYLSGNQSFSKLCSALTVSIVQNEALCSQ